ncbi:S1 RNA-binding domain-containing protein [Weissella coleopterorum]|uniref:S1 RNA-binding domain-containing protein n=1 Tax=Weissella coleopterorum TaxID=2714949 RepID=A0A6G8B1G5_9LACO|nr:CvfD/Ygs/GSP13 family RNA-binding post-transcriptional regulator [Weissella coleopterorum]QIL50973.1 S1 RNA-binding domain-containing protein [Weissella coleopterorum]
MGYHIGQLVEGVITGIQPYGAFLQLDAHTQGLVHISECRSAYIKSVDEELAVGDVVKVVVLNIDKYSNKISLSRRETLLDEIKLPIVVEKYPKKGKIHYWTNQYTEYGFKTIAESHSQMLQEALERLR